VPAGGEPRVDVEVEVPDERVEVAAGVRDETDPETVPAKRLEHGDRVLVQLEVLGAEPAVRDRFRDRPHARAVAVAAHPADDVLGEADPDLLVVVELGVVLEVLERGGARLRVPSRVERKAKALARGPVAVGPEQGAGLRDREVDVEEDRREFRHGLGVAD
jgi:hypothetical protein